MKNIFSNSILILLVTFLFTSCQKSSRFEIDTAKNMVEVKIQRFDKDLILLDTANIEASIKVLNERYKKFLPVYCSEILDTASSNSQALGHLFTQFLSDTTFKAVNKITLETFNDISDIEKNVSDAFTYIHYYFPDVKLPEIYFFVSGFNRSVLMNEQFISLGTDYYLGSDFPAYKNFTYEYLLKNMQRKCVATDLVSATLFRIFANNSNLDRLLDDMLYRGKIMYLLSVFMPDEKPEDLMVYTPEQWKWCQTNEKQIWAAIIDQKHLFSTDMLLIRKYMNDAPFTAPISQDSPGRLGTWIGWQIIDSYMKKNEKTGLQDLMNESNYQKILEESGYRP